MTRILSIVVAMSLAASAWGLKVDERVENFRLFDHKGGSHELYYYDDARAVVFLVQGNGCPIVRNAAPSSGVPAAYGKSSVKVVVPVDFRLEG